MTIYTGGVYIIFDMTGQVPQMPVNQAAIPAQYPPGSQPMYANQQPGVPVYQAAPGQPGVQGYQPTMQQPGVPVYAVAPQQSGVPVSNAIPQQPVQYQTAPTGYAPVAPHTPGPNQGDESQINLTTAGDEEIFTKA